MQRRISVFEADLILADNRFQDPGRWLFAEKTPEGKKVSAELKKFLSLVLVNFGVNGNSFKIIANGLVDWFLHSVVTNIVLNTSNQIEKAKYKASSVNIRSKSYKLKKR